MKRGNKMKKILIKIILLVLVLGSITGCSSTPKEIYGEQYNFNYIKPTENIEAKFYSYSINANGEAKKYNNL